MINKNATNNAKAIAIVLVLMGHLVSANKTTLPSYIQEFATFSVDVFLFLSGYGLTKSFDRNGIKGFLSKRFSAVYIPFLIATIITAMYRGFYDERWHEIIKTLVFYSKTLPIDPTMWFVYFICLWYVCFWAAFSMFRGHVLQIISLLSLAVVFTHLPSREYSYVLSSMFSLHSFSFPAGVIFARYISFNKSQQHLICWSSIILFATLFYNVTIKNNPNLVSMTGVVFAVSLIVTISLINKTNSILSFLGSHSYEIYLFEGIFRWNNFSNDKIINAILFFITAMSLAVFFKPIMERAKSLLAPAVLLIKKPL